MTPDMGPLVRAVLVAGLVAGLLTGAFHLVVSEPLVDRAIALEEQAREREAAAGGVVERHEEVFSRRTQKVGLLLGAALYGLAAGAVFGGAFALLAGRLPGRATRARVAALALAAFVAVVLVPFLRYPANPPGAGAPETLLGRQLLYTACVLLSFAGLWLAWRLAARLRVRAGAAPSIASGAAFFVVWAVALLLLLPAVDEAGGVPADLLWRFRLATAAGQALFTALFAAVFATVLDRAERAALGESPRPA